MLTRRVASLLLCGLLVGNVALAAPAAETEEVKVFEAPPGTRVRISNQDGAVRVGVWQQPQVRVIARRRASALTREAERKLMSLMSLRTEQRGPDLFVEGRVERFSAFGWLSYSLQLDVTVPQKADVQVRCADGSIQIVGIEGSIEARTRDGHIEARELTGEVSLSSDDGHLQLENVSGRVRADTSDGSIQYRGRPERLELRTADGSISAEILPGAKMGSNWTVRTFDGSINVVLPPDLDANLDADTRDGRVLVNLPGVQGNPRAGRFSGKLNHGGYLLVVHTSDGSIHVGSH